MSVYRKINEMNVCLMDSDSPTQRCYAMNITSLEYSNAHAHTRRQTADVPARGAFCNIPFLAGVRLFSCLAEKCIFLANSPVLHHQCRGKVFLSSGSRSIKAWLPLLLSASFFSLMENLAFCDTLHVPHCFLFAHTEAIQKPKSEWKKVSTLY